MEKREESFTNLMTFWRNIEALSPQSIPKSAPKDSHEPTRDLSENVIPPWLDVDFRKRAIPKSREWQHTVYTNRYKLERYIKLLEGCIGKTEDVFEERATGESCVFALAFSDDGRPLTETFVLSMAAWGLGVVSTRGLAGLVQSDACDTTNLHKVEKPHRWPYTNSGFAGFDMQQDALREELAWRLGNLSVTATVDSRWLNDFAQLVIQKCRLQNLVGNENSHRSKSVQIRRRQTANSNGDQTRSEVAAESIAKKTDDFLNSFLIRDLNQIISAGSSRASICLRDYVDASVRGDRVDVRKARKTALEFLHPNNFPTGCWPAEHPLVWSQQVAINAMWQGVGRSGGVFAVNGPPGTGKTTLLRDVVAAVIVERAKVLARDGSVLLEEKKAITVGSRQIPIYGLSRELAGFSIVVASSNNGAVENVSLELPKKNAIDKKWHGEIDAYSDIASGLLGVDAWALVSGRLGNKANRDKFANTFWWQSCENGARVSGLRERLVDIVAGRKKPTLHWSDAVQRFSEALSDEQKWRTQLSHYCDLGSEDAAAARDTEQARIACDTDLATWNELKIKLADLVAERARDEASRDSLRRRIELVNESRPGFLEWLSSWGRSQVKWRTQVQDLIVELGALDERIDSKREQIAVGRKTFGDTEKRIADNLQRIEQLSHRLQQIHVGLAEAKHVLGGHWPDLGAIENEQEQTSPWAHPEWRAARIRVFLTAMNLHRAFIENNAGPMLANLGLAMDVLSSGAQVGDNGRIAFDSLSLACPVISTTFASVATLFGTLGPDSLGWLLVDEAGQAVPQAAAGAMWRSRRAVVVGDPLQLEPIATLPVTVEAALSACSGGTSTQFYPSRTSVQSLADGRAQIGAYVGVSEQPLWVGAPLRVHRRCDEPMFSISNAVAYDGLMVHKKQPIAVPWPASTWIDVKASSVDGNWIPQEGDALRHLLARLIRDYKVAPDAIFLISPFREVVRQLRRIGAEFGLNERKVGTIHTTQGKEEDVVIMVLGGGTGGARNWAASKPNLLNVAVSRAKSRFYVIGDRADWACRRHFDVMSRFLFK